MKRCTKCEIEKSEDEFYPRPRGAGGLRPDCKLCARRAVAARRARKIQDGTWARSYKNNQLRMKYGISIDDFEVMLTAQGGVCAVCGREETRGRSLAVDHNHVTGAVRGLLCADCNTAVGLLGDDPERMRAAALYVEKELGPLEAKI